jgi:hypothetical protein
VFRVVKEFIKSFVAANSANEAARMLLKRGVSLISGYRSRAELREPFCFPSRTKKPNTFYRKNCMINSLQETTVFFGHENENPLNSSTPFIIAAAAALETFAFGGDKAGKRPIVIGTGLYPGICGSGRLRSAGTQCAHNSQAHPIRAHARQLLMVVELGSC